MKRWQYLDTTGYRRRYNDPWAWTFHPRCEVDEGIEGSEIAILNELGSHGWELVVESHTETSIGTFPGSYCRLLLRRPIDD